jgi:hypothetical protein
MRGKQDNSEVYDSSLTIAADSFLQTPVYQQFLKFRKYKQEIADGKPINVDDFIASNPQYYHTYVLAGDYLFERELYQKALAMYSTALTKEIATTKERDYINKQIEKCRKKSGS